MSGSNRLDSYKGSLQSSKNVSGLYRGRVEYNKDPKKVGRVRVRIPLLHGIEGSGRGYIATEYLPWASPSFMGAGAGFGSFIVPEVGEYVFVLFEGNSITSPVYIGSCYGYGADSKPYGSLQKDEGGNYGGDGVWESAPGLIETPKDAQKDDLRPTKKIVYKSPKGASIEIEDRDEQENIAIMDMLGQVIKIESNVTASENTNNNAQRKSGDVESNDPSMLPEYVDSRVLIMGANRQKIEMTSSSLDGESVIRVANRDISIELVSPNSSSEQDSIQIKIGNTVITGNKDSLRVGSEFFRVDAENIRLVGAVTVEEE